MYYSKVISDYRRLLAAFCRRRWSIQVLIRSFSSSFITAKPNGLTHSRQNKSHKMKPKDIWNGLRRLAGTSTSGLRFRKLEGPHCNNAETIFAVQMMHKDKGINTLVTVYSVLARRSRCFAHELAPLVSADRAAARRSITSNVELLIPITSVNTILYYFYQNYFNNTFIGYVQVRGDNI